MRPQLLATIVTLLLPARSLVAQDPIQQTPPDTASACSAAAYRQFDFWIGAWTVIEPAGDTAGRNLIEPIVGGCALRETWHGADGGVGTSITSFDRHSGRWQQTWVDDRGSLLVLRGAQQPDGSILMEGSHTGRAGGTIVNRVRWSARGDGTVRQFWQVSRDGGTTWQDFFDGTYRRER